MSCASQHPCRTQDRGTGPAMRNWVTPTSEMTCPKNHATFLPPAPMACLSAAAGRNTPPKRDHGHAVLSNLTGGPLADEAGHVQRAGAVTAFMPATVELAGQLHPRLVPHRKGRPPPWGRRACDLKSSADRYAPTGRAREVRRAVRLPTRSRLAGRRHPPAAGAYGKFGGTRFPRAAQRASRPLAGDP